ncbi:mucin-associated surface protein (MASP) [Trypanosoma cruzi]|uniref:Mucin-associated surface protein (MASP) n=1 Tax=Trypanosoma cruzi TaxID=5693 RepID=A0A7J6Y770_TRYCR|nr:mucin-associated surface protein (MASP) [Trypanosoma cruzi]
MAMMMTGRVLLLVCALCVLWCGAGGRCDEERAGDTPDGLSGASLTGSGETLPTEPKALSQLPDSLNLPSKPQKNEESERLPSKESLKANEENSFERPVVNEDEPLQEETPKQLSESEEDLLKTQKEGNKTQLLQDEVQKGKQSTPHGQPTNQALQPSVESHADSPGGPSGGDDSLGSPSSGVIPLPHGDGDRGITGSIPSNLQSTSPKAVLPTEADAARHTLPNTQAVEGDNTNSAATPGSGGPSFLEEQKTKDLQSETHKTAGSSGDLNTESQGSGKVQLELIGSTTLEPQNSHGIEKTETKGSESHNTNISTNLLAAKEPGHEQEKNNENPASTPNKTQGISAGTREEAPASHPNESTSPIQQEKFTGIKTTEDVQSPDAAATEKRQTGDKTKDGDSDGSTAVSHTTFPLLLLLVVACAAAAAVAE